MTYKEGDGKALAQEHLDLHVKTFNELKENEQAGMLSEKQKKLLKELEQRIGELQKRIESSTDHECLILVFEEAGGPWQKDWLKRFKEADAHPGKYKS
jgi:hypothetical protein